MNKVELTELEKEFVPSVEAFELKKLGFDKPCFGYYEQWVNTNNEVKQMFRIGQVKGVFDGITPAPTFSQAFRFFREKGIRFEISPRLSDLGVFYKVLFPDGQEKNVSYDTYEEAELACLKSLIKIANLQKQ